MSFLNGRVRGAKHCHGNTPTVRSVKSCFVFSGQFFMDSLASTAGETHRDTHTHSFDQSLSPVSTAKRTSLHSCNVPDKIPLCSFWINVALLTASHQRYNLSIPRIPSVYVIQRTGWQCDDGDVEAVRRICAPLLEENRFFCMFIFVQTFRSEACQAP